MTDELIEKDQFQEWFENRIICGQWFDDNAAIKDCPDVWKKFTQEQDEEATRFMLQKYLTTKTARKYYTPAEVYQDYRAWAIYNAYDPWKQRRFSHKFWPTLRDMIGEGGRRKVQGYNQYSGFDFVDAGNIAKSPDISRLQIYGVYPW